MREEERRRDEEWKIPDRHSTLSVPFCQDLPDGCIRQRFISSPKSDSEGPSPGVDPSLRRTGRMRMI